MSTDIVASDDQKLLLPIVLPGELVSHSKQISDYVREALEEGVDYGSLAQTGEKSQEKFLFKAGAERLTIAFGMVATFNVLESEIDHDREQQIITKKGNRIETRGLYRFTVECRLTVRKTGEVMGAAIGMASSTESRFSYSPGDNISNILQMAQKRAHVAACKTVFGLSKIFNDDRDETSKQAAAAEPPKTFNGAGLKEKCRGMGWSNEQFLAFRTRATELQISFSNVLKAMIAKRDPISFDEAMAALSAGDKSAANKSAEVIETHGEDKPSQSQILDAIKQVIRDLGWECTTADDFEVVCQALNPVDAPDENSEEMTTYLSVVLNALQRIQRGEMVAPQLVHINYDPFED